MQLVIFLLCLTISFVARSHLGVTIVAMTDISPEETNPIKVKNITNDFNTENVIINESEHNFGNLDKDKQFNFTKPDTGVEYNTESKWNVFKVSKIILTRVKLYSKY